MHEEIETYEAFEAKYHEAVKCGMKYAGLVARSFFDIAGSLEERYPEWALRADETLGAKAA